MPAWYGQLTGVKIEMNACWLVQTLGGATLSVTFKITDLPLTNLLSVQRRNKIILLKTFILLMRDSSGGSQSLKTMATLN